jgi:transposase-like protein
MSPTYSAAFKSRMVQKLTAPGGPSATALAAEIGVAQPTLSRWVREASGRVVAMTEEKKRSKSAGGKRPQDWTAEERLAVVLEASSLSAEDLGGYLRQRGLHRTTLERWRSQMLQGLASSPRRSKGSGSSKEARKIRSLEKELRRKDKALAEAAALLVLQKKVQAIWGDEDDDTPPRSGK